MHGFRSLRELVLPLGGVTLVTGPNGSGKSSLYRSLQLLAGAASGGLVQAVAAEGGLPSVLWAGPETISQEMKRGEAPIQGTARRSRPVSLMLGFSSDDVGYLIDIGLPQPQQTAFQHDPVIKREFIFSGPLLRPASVLVSRKGSQLRVLTDAGWRRLSVELDGRSSVLHEIAEPEAYPELRAVRLEVSGWRFYDALRTDPAAPARHPAVRTWTPILAGDGSDLAAAVQTVLESPFAGPLADAVGDALGASLAVTDAGTRLDLRVHQRGLLRSMGATELSDGTLRFILLATALTSPRPPRLLVLNEPETSLHPQVLPGLAALVADAASRCQIVVVSHDTSLVSALTQHPALDVVHHELIRDTGETVVLGQGRISRPAWEWGRR